MYSKLTQASKRPMTARERFGLILFILKFLFSKFGIFILFLSLNVIGNTKIKDAGIRCVATGNPILPGLSSGWGTQPSDPQSSSCSGSKIAKHLTQDSYPQHNNRISIPRTSSREFAPCTSDLQEEKKLVCSASTTHTQRPEATQQALSLDSVKVSEIGICPPHALFSKLKIYCIIATIVTLFLNPQQTKYFGGLAVALKQAGLFSKYGKSEKTVYVFSWIFIVLFAQMSYSSAFLENTLSLPGDPGGYLATSYTSSDCRITEHQASSWVSDEVEDYETRVK